MAQTARNLIDAMLKDGKVTQTEMAKDLGITRQALGVRFKKDNFTVDQLFKIADRCGFEIYAVRKDSLDAIQARVGGTIHLKKMIGGVMFDTSKADCICGSPRVAGCYFELYKQDGKYYLASSHALYIGMEDSAVEISEVNAMRFCEQCGHLDKFR